MAIHIGSWNIGNNNKRVGGSDSRYLRSGGGAVGFGVCGTPIWHDVLLWDDNKIWID